MHLEIPGLLLKNFLMLLLFLLPAMVAKQRKLFSESKRKCQKELEIVQEIIGAFGTIFLTTVFKRYLPIKYSSL